MRWLYHLARGGAAADDADRSDGFVHCSWADEVAASAQLHFPADADRVAWRIDPRRLPEPPEVADTPRGPMPHLRGPLPQDAIRELHPRQSWTSLPDRVTGHRIALLGFEGMTLLDLVGVLDPLSRLRTMGFDPDVATEIAGISGDCVWAGDGARLLAQAVRPDLSSYDLVVVPGGHGTRQLSRDPGVSAWLRERPAHWWWASVCTGSLVLAGAGLLEGRRATTHPNAVADLGSFAGVEVVRDRVVRDGPIFTAGGVTSGLDLGLRLVAELADAATAARIATQMQVREW